MAKAKPLSASNKDRVDHISTTPTEQIVTLTNGITIRCGIDQDVNGVLAEMDNPTPAKA